MISEHVHAVPHLVTALSGPLQHIESHFLKHQAHIEAWLRQQWKQTPAPFYTSVDLRNAGFKLAPVDTNLFPAGFNNLNSAFLPLCIQAVQSAIEDFDPDACKVLLIPENHTRNLYYLESVATFCDILRKAGYEVRIGSLLDLQETLHITLPSGGKISLEPLIRQNHRVGLKNFDPCLVLLNNDLSGGLPDILENIQQPILPPPELGWSNRFKSEHFAHYRRVAKEFSEHVEIDPWLIDPLFKNCGEINFMKRSGEECLTRNVRELLSAVEKKYHEYGVEQDPFVIVKADAGTYGMGVMTVHNADDISELNRKQRSRMSATKESRQISEVIIQEGVYTFETWGKDNASAEPVVYMIGHFVVGGFYRVHQRRGKNENLNAPGMYFEPLAFVDSCITPDQNMAPDARPNRFYAYGVIARLGMLAAARELAEHV